MTQCFAVHINVEVSMYMSAELPSDFQTQNYNQLNTMSNIDNCIVKPRANYSNTDGAKGIMNFYYSNTNG